MEVESGHSFWMDGVVKGWEKPGDLCRMDEGPEGLVLGGREGSGVGPEWTRGFGGG